MIRALVPGDEQALEAFLAERAATSMFLRSNLRRAGLELRGQRHGGTWVARFEGDEIAGVAMHAWNDNLTLQCAANPGELVTMALRASGRPLGGLVGPFAQVAAARSALDLGTRPVVLDAVEDLFALDLARLDAPPSPAVRRATPGDLPVAIPWRIAYEIEEIHADPDGDGLDRRVRDTVDALVAQGCLFLAEEHGVAVAMSAFNAVIPDCAQVGGVYTPPALRCRGYGRAVVAGSLALARAEGATRSILFTGVENTAAQRAYRAIGFERVGDYAICLFASPAGAAEDQDRAR